MTLAQWSGSIFWRTVFRAAFGELGDKTFYLIAALIIWEPMKGIYAGRALWQRFCVFCGAYGALLTRTILMACNIKPDSWAVVFDFCATALLAVMNIVAVRDLRREGTLDKTVSEDEPFSEDGAAAGNPFEKDDTAGQSYGAAPAEKAVPKIAKPSMVSLVMGSRTFVLTYVLTFLVDVDDKSPNHLLASVHTGFDFVIGALIGQLLAIFVAMVFSFALVFVFDDKQLAIATVLVTAGLFLTCLSQAVLDIGPLRPQPERVHPTFLSVAPA